MPADNRPNVVGWQERRLDRAIPRTYPAKVNRDEAVPNGATSLLVEIHPGLAGDLLAC